MNSAPSRQRHAARLRRACGLVVFVVAWGSTGGPVSAPPAGEVTPPVPVAPASPPAHGSASPTQAVATPRDGVAMRSYTFTDTSRSLSAPTPRSANSATPARTIVTEIYCPATGNGPFPVVVFSHGLRGLPSDYRALLNNWVQAGLLVIAPVYPMTSRGAPEVVATDLPKQPADARFALTNVLARADDPADPLHTRLDGAHVAAVGHSEGALTTVGLFTACCRDA